MLALAVGADLGAVLVPGVAAGVVGPLDYGFDEYRISVDAATALSAMGGVSGAVAVPPNPVLPQGAIQMDIAIGSQIPALLGVFAPVDPCRRFAQLEVQGGTVTIAVGDTFSTTCASSWPRCRQTLEKARSSPPGSLLSSTPSIRSMHNAPSRECCG